MPEASEKLPMKVWIIVTYISSFFLLKAQADLLCAKNTIRLIFSSTIA
jgi:hypothetical protein